MSPKVALVTGSGRRRVGQHVAEALARSGYAVCVHYRTAAAEAHEAAKHLESLGTRALAVQADLADENAVRKVVDACLDRFGRVDAVVNAAAIWQSKPLEETTADDVRRHFETNTLGTFLVCRHAGLAMVAQETGGSIVNFGDWAVTRPYLNYSAYFVSKGAIETMTRTLAVELGTRNPKVRVNCILPGPVMLPDDISAEERAKSIAGTLVKREGSPQNIAQAVLHFVENDFVTGATLAVDGGRTVYAPQ